MSATVTVERRFAAPPEAVFDAWLDPAAASRFLFATPGGVMEKVEIDPHIGGGFTVIERRGETQAEHHGEYVEIDRPRRLAFDFWTSFSAERTRVSIDIEPDGGGSRVTLTHEGVGADWTEKTRQGWTTILDGLARTLES
ncbi:MAG: SRPBCC domain-containing protein [Alphaproteobacteria bacterium]|nr:MAG: SRPBCC domain-containing protein [Alphaproteobacteria bacterium]